jgi:hypothetical protein
MTRLLAAFTTRFINMPFHIAVLLEDIKLVRVSVSTSEWNSDVSCSLEAFVFRNSLLTQEAFIQSDKRMVYILRRVEPQDFQLDDWGSVRAHSNPGVRLALW